MALAPPSSADVAIPGRAWDGHDYASSDGRWVEVCDMEDDANRVYGESETTTGTHRVFDGNGHAGGCGNAIFNRVREFRVCEEIDFWPDSCSGWVGP
ncbi:hypothetical protein SAMN05661093_03650 [Kibdelosporangium aridum]|uniref:Uncharacterized protein n=1 Tax=Kibdelosporangium aridum TaxID=2030 RepID=A0A1Y5XJU4_KIBAR|nr:hypothetical protein SAMN05661093_03650 [Kibdelosporangium aridum]